MGVAAAGRFYLSFEYIWFSPCVDLQLMYIFHRPGHLRAWLDSAGSSGLVGFVPTMGALHEGHISLVRQSLAATQTTVVSVFVNPRQFNDAGDLARYPRTVDQDIRLLGEAGATVLFLPEVEDIYPPGDTAEIDFDPGPLASGMEGLFRPGHFKGMAEVVYRLLRIVGPDKLYMGQKDYQQLAIVRQMVRHYHLPVDVVMCPTEREPNGLAMSSRNIRLSAEARARAGVIYQTLLEGGEAFRRGRTADEVRTQALARLRAEGLDSDYFEIVDGHTMTPVTLFAAESFVIACCAVRTEGVRLLDNMIWSAPGHPSTPES